MMVICFVWFATGVCILSAYSAQLNYTPVNEFTLSCHYVPRGGKHCLHDTLCKVVLCLPQINTYFLMIPKSFHIRHSTQAGGVNIQCTRL